ncbi:hypothetical protein [Thermococcus sp.]|uniref:hypothetical protein n=1 Tax=Thermococcus sp. TaxID=35749 RepID=UPI002602D487|nr:hypothetical protein [Thermococcus sp.]
MPDNVYREALRLAANIRDAYLRAVTYSRLGYYMYRAKQPEYKTAFKYAFNVISSMDNPVLATKALLEVGMYLRMIGSDMARKTFAQVHDAVVGFPQPLRDDLLEDLVLRLLELDLPDDALFYVGDVEDDIKRNDLLLKILRVYLRRGNMRRAYVVINRIDEEPWRSIAAIETLKVHLKREEFGSAIKILAELKSDYWLGEAMREVATYLKGADVPKATYQKFVDIALSLSTSESTGSEVLTSLLVGMGAQGEVDFVLDVLKKLPSDVRLRVMKGIVDAALDRVDVLERLLKALKGREFEEVAAFTLGKLLSRSANDEYSGLVKEVGGRTADDALLVKVATYLAKLGDFEAAWNFASKVRGNYLRSLAFGSIAVAKLKEGDIDGAIDAALEVKDPKWGSWLLSEILAKILELQAEGGFREDIEERAESQRALWEGG